MNTYTHLGLEDATDELKRMEELSDAGKELDKGKGENPVSQKMFRVIQWMKGEATPFPPRFGQCRANVY